MSARWLLLLAGLYLGQTANAQVLAEWVQNDPTNDPNKLALGYPVPIPVDTPLPFNGFRTYAGLHTRHMDLSATTPWVHPHDIGTTINGRTIWAYRLGDDDFSTILGFPEAAMLTNGGIHAREWQSPEVVTGILELLATHPADKHFYDYLRDNVNMVVIPSLNIDGFLQTQRYPRHNYLGSDPSFPASSPRDGRMRRKNMRGVDEQLNTLADHLQGIDLNRNNPPFWATSGSSSGDNNSLVYHGTAPQSEPETQALDVAAQLGPVEHLRMYTDVHSFSQVHFWTQGSNSRLNNIASRLLGLFTNHHQAFPAGKDYLSVPSFGDGGIGTTADYFNFGYQVPSWTLEVEPSGNFHPHRPGRGADYGGTNENGHDGFILPDSEVRRVSEQLAQTFAAAYYRQAGPPSIHAVRVVESDSQAVIFEAEWDRVDDSTRTLHHWQLRPLEMDRDYELRIVYDKPMRWRENGEVVPFQGVAGGFVGQFTDLMVNDSVLNNVVGEATWLDQPGTYLHYRDDTVSVPLLIARDGINDPLISGSTPATLRHLTWDMVGLVNDANPATVIGWAEGHWTGLENSEGNEADFGGRDTTITLEVSDQVLTPGPFVIEPGTAAAWGDPERVGEGFVIEIISDTQAVMFWFTNDDDGGQDWYIAVGNIRGNRLEFPEVLRVSGGVFGDAFDPEAITETPVGHAKFTWSDCDNGFMDWHVGNRRGRQNLVRLTSILGLPCTFQKPQLGAPNPPVRQEAQYSGAWGDPTHNGEGFTVEVLNNETVLVFWFSFGPDGHRRWYFGIGEITPDGRFVWDNLLTTVGGVFGEDFDPDDVEEVHWGTLELDLSCSGGTATYSSVEAGFGSGQQQPLKLTNFPGLECDA